MNDIDTTWESELLDTEVRVAFTELDVCKYLDDCILHWREEKSSTKKDSFEQRIAEAYIDAFQSVHISLFGTLLHTEGHKKI